MSRKRKDKLPLGILSIQRLSTEGLVVLINHVPREYAEYVADHINSNIPIWVVVFRGSIIGYMYNGHWLMFVAFKRGKRGKTQ